MFALIVNWTSSLLAFDRTVTTLRCTPLLPEPSKINSRLSRSPGFKGSLLQPGVVHPQLASTEVISSSDPPPFA